MFPDNAGNVLELLIIIGASFAVVFLTIHIQEKD